MRPQLILLKQAILNLAPAQVNEEIRAALTLDNPKYLDAKKYGRWTGNIPRHLHLYKRRKSALYLPRGFTKQALEICRKHGVEPHATDYRITHPEVDFTFKGKLRDYQQQAVDDVLSHDYGILEAATGSGKTVMALAVIAARKQPSLIICHTKELLNQWVDRIESFLNISPGQIGSGKFQVQPITVAMVQTLRKRTEEVQDFFGQIIVDECHRTPTATFSACVQENYAKYLLGLSATPYRRDGLSKYINFSLGDTIHRVDPEMLRDTGAVLRAKVEIRETEFQYYYSDDYQDMISELTQDYERNRLIARDVEIEAMGSTGASLVVSDRIEHLETLLDMTHLDGKALLTGSTPTREREKIVQDLAAGKIKVLFSTLSLIGEGFDAPGLTSLFLATPIKFEGRLIQVIGRILRPAEGKTPIIYDFQDINQPVLKAQAKERNKVFYEVS